MKVLALDLAKHTGWAFGESGGNPAPESGTWKLKESGHLTLRGALARELRFFFRDHGPPDLIAVETPLHPSQSKGADAVISQQRFHGCIEAVAGLWGCEWRSDTPATIRKYVCGQANAGQREDTKAMVMRALEWRGFAPADDNQGDALALWLYVNHVVLRHREHQLVLSEQVEKTKRRTRR